jgi:hypothetical protein
MNRSELLAMQDDVVLSAFSLPIRRLDGSRVAIQVLINTVDLDAEIYVQASVDGVYYETDTSSKYTVAGEDTSVLYEIDNPSSEYYRIRIVRNTGTYDVKIQALVSGGN